MSDLNFYPELTSSILQPSRILKTADEAVLKQEFKIKIKIKFDPEDRAKSTVITIFFPLGTVSAIS